VDEHRPERELEAAKHLTVQRDNEHVQGNQPVEIYQMSAELKLAMRLLVPWRKESSCIILE
jgi:hypothetical protein